MPGDYFRSIVEFATESYDRLPAVIRSPVDRLIRTIRLASSLLADIRLQVIRCDCTGPGRDLPFRLLYVGRRQQLAPALSLFGYRLTRETRLDVIHCWRLRNFLDRYTAGEEVLFLHVNRVLCRWLSREGLIAVPPSIKAVLPLAETLEQTKAAFSESIRRKIRRTALSHYSWHISRDKDSLRRFYHEFYRAYALARFGIFAQVASFPKVRRLFRTGLLVFITRDDEAVAACICRKIDGVLWFELFGRALRGGKVRDEQSGDALYQALLELAYEQGCTHINFRDSRPFLNDGTLQYKLRWGGHLHCDQRAPRQLLVDTRRLDERRFHPFLDHYPVFIDDGRLSGLVLLAQKHRATARELRAITNTYLRPGLAKLAVWSFSGFSESALLYGGESPGRLELIDLSGPHAVKDPGQHVADSPHRKDRKNAIPLRYREQRE